MRKQSKTEVEATSVNEVVGTRSRMKEKEREERNDEACGTSVTNKVGRERGG